jgi:hypothetical protein
MKRKGTPTPRRVQRAIATIQDYLEEIECEFAVISRGGTSFHKTSVPAMDADEIRRWQRYAEDEESGGIVRPPGTGRKS